VTWETLELLKSRVGSAVELNPGRILRESRFCERHISNAFVLAEVSEDGSSVILERRSGCQVAIPMEAIVSFQLPGAELKIRGHVYVGPGLDECEYVDD
jgi:hypothetical protein